MPIPEGLTPTSRHRVLLQRGDKHEWWAYESENPPGYVDGQGITYSGVTYTIRPASGGPALILLAAEVDGFFLATAWQYGEEAIREDAYRPGL